MERQSPPTERVIRLLDFLVAHPSERFTVSELARRTEISKPTCIGIVKALTKGGYLDRDQRTGAYALGSTMIAAGRAAMEGLAPLSLVHEAISAVAEQTGHACTAAAVRDDYLTIIERAGPPSLYDPLIQIGVRQVMVPPTGKLAMAFENDDHIAWWMDRDPAESTPLDRKRFMAIVREARSVGYLVGQAGESRHMLETLLSPLGRKTLSEDMVSAISQVAASFGDELYLQRELRSGRRHPVSTVAAPAYDVEGRVKLTVVLYVADDAVTYKDIQRFGADVMAAGDAITAALGGRNPWR